jgi:hypothetical protein
MKLSNSVKYENIVCTYLWSPLITRKQGFVRRICRAKARLGSTLFVCVVPTSICLTTIEIHTATTRGAATVGNFL